MSIDTVWRIRIGDQEYAAASLQELQGWHSAGRFTDTDYVYNPILGKWLYAAEVAELKKAPAIVPGKVIPAGAFVCTTCRNIVQPTNRGGCLSLN